MKGLECAPSFISLDSLHFKIPKAKPLIISTHNLRPSSAYVAASQPSSWGLHKSDFHPPVIPKLHTPPLTKFKIGRCQLSLSTDKDSNIAQARKAIEKSALNAQTLSLLYSFSCFDDLHFKHKPLTLTISSHSGLIVAIHREKAKRPFPSARANPGGNESYGGASLRSDDVNIVERILLFDTSTGYKYKMKQIDDDNGGGGGGDDNDGNGDDDAHEYDPNNNNNNNNNNGESEDDGSNGGGAHSSNDGWGNMACGRLKCVWAPIMLAGGILLGYFLAASKNNAMKNTTNEHRQGPTYEILSRNKLAPSIFGPNWFPN